MTKDEALKLALETLESIQAVYPCETVGRRITAIKEALAQPEQEPVAWQWLGSAHFRKKLPKNADITAWNSLYSAPQRTWVGLTEEERDGKRVLENGLLFNTAEVQVWELAIDYAEARLKEKNT